MHWKAELQDQGRNRQVAGGQVHFAILQRAHFQNGQVPGGFDSVQVSVQMEYNQQLAQD